MARKIGYRRVSSNEQNLERQDLSYCDRVFEEKVSGGSMKRPELAKMLDSCGLAMKSTFGPSTA
ncbi:recombinase family protein [Roseibium sp. RKSG952]|uniref:recombinase family protein n=1 Tax=Roseibium sp. RKSG952 TaxID=2529384 RepID=UPI001AD8B246